MDSTTSDVIVLQYVFIEKKSAQFKLMLFKGQLYLYKNKSIAVQELDVHVVQMYELVSLHVTSSSTLF